LSIGQTAPTVTLPDQDGQEHTLPNNQWTLIYFYPQDATPGCTTDACGIRDNYEQLTQFVQVYGISKDSVESHKAFSQKYHLQFPLLSDTEKTALQAYGAWENEATLRISYIINPENQIVKVYPNVNPTQHAQEILEDIKALVAA